MSPPAPQTRTEGHRPPVSAVRLILTVGGWVVGLFGLLRLDWVQQRVLLPLGSAQQQIAGDLMGASTTAVVVDISCTGADEMALCVGVIMAFPAAWSARVRGALGGLALLLALNTVRIGSLSLVADDRAMLDLLHLYVWPAMLVVAVLAYVFGWMARVTDAGTDTNPPTTGAQGSPGLAWRPTSRLPRGSTAVPGSTPSLARSPPAARSSSGVSGCRPPPQETS